MAAVAAVSATAGLNASANAQRPAASQGSAMTAATTTATTTTGTGMTGTGTAATTMAAAAADATSSREENSSTTTTSMAAAQTPHVAPAHPVLVKTQRQWVFTPDELARTPSILDGMPQRVEQINRSKGVNFILQVGMLLKIPQSTLITASIYLHRFFMRYSMKGSSADGGGGGGGGGARAGLHYYDVAGTALFLATKVDENCRKFKDFVVACARVGSKNPQLLVDEQSKVFWNWRDAILLHETLLLEALCFDLQLELPQKFLWEMLGHFGMRDDKRLRNSAWAFLNDSMYTVLCVRFPARTIAAGALYAGARHVGVAFPDDARGRSWWEQLELALEDLRDVCNALADIYDDIAVQASLKARPEHVPAPASELHEPTRHLAHNLDSAGASSTGTATATGTRQGTPDSAAAAAAAVAAAAAQAGLNAGRKRERERETSPALSLPDSVKRVKTEDTPASAGQDPLAPAGSAASLRTTPVAAASA
ncbi:hypothetical protein KEM52_002864 [Ascosphaera acerosa]|nr:hypothetical protein KEM52_002864 [Ascosphaera acerosa]